MLNNINSSRTTSTWRSSAAIAHPLIVAIWGGYPWNENIWGANLTARYDGFELMSAGQLIFGPNDAPMPRWRSELVRRLPGVFSNLGFHSARTGSDYGNHRWGWIVHDISCYTFIGLPNYPPSDMRNLAQSDVDQALRAGRTVASRLGGVASMRLRDAQGRHFAIGSWFTLPANSTLNGEVVLRAALSGNYRVRLIEDDFRRQWTLYNAALNAGQIITIPIPLDLDISFPGGQRFYHVIVDGADSIYTSPIFIRQ